MKDAGKPEVIGSDGLRGVLLDPLPVRPARQETVRVRLTDSSVVRVPADSFVTGSDGTLLMPFGPDDFARAGSAPDESQSDGEGVIPVIAEEVVVGRKAVPTGGVRVTRRVLEHDETVEVPVVRERLDVRRVAVGRDVDGPLPVRREGDTTIIPIVVEEIVVTKRYRLKEEVHVTRTAREELHRERVTVMRQEPVIEEMDARGHARPAPEPETPVSPVPRRRPRKSILGEN
jgi:uncharacterized protein (TIGR02271 family)